MSRVLIVDDDVGTLETFEFILRRAGVRVLTAQLGLHGLEYTRHNRVDLVLADLRLPDFSGIDLLHHLRNERNDVPVAIMTAFGTISSAVEAMKLGAVDYVEKPLSEHDVLRVVESGLVRSLPWENERTPHDTPEPHAATEWAKLVVSALGATSDPKNLHEWGKLVHAARSTLENRCNAASVSAKVSLDFARVLRAIVHARRMDCKPEALLDSDPRTVQRLMAAAGLRGNAQLPDPIHFLDLQRLVTDPLAIAAVRRALASQGIVAN